MLVAGCVRGIRPRYVSVLLPDNIFAQLPVTSISPPYTQVLEELRQEKISEKVSLIFIKYRMTLKELGIMSEYVMKIKIKAYVNIGIQYFLFNIYD